MLAHTMPRRSPKRYPHGAPSLAPMLPRHLKGDMVAFTVSGRSPNRGPRYDEILPHDAPPLAQTLPRHLKDEMVAITNVNRGIVIIQQYVREFSYRFANEETDEQASRFKSKQMLMKP